MTKHVHKKIEDFMNKKAFGALSVARCSISYSDFVPRASLNPDPSIEKFSEKLMSLLMDGANPTLNPLMDALLQNDSNDLQESIQIYVKNNCKFNTVDCDSKNDIMTLSVDISLLWSNVTPFLSQEEIVIENASIQTPLFRYEIKE